MLHSLTFLGERTLRHGSCDLALGTYFARLEKLGQGEETRCERSPALGKVVSVQGNQHHCFTANDLLRRRNFHDSAIRHAMKPYLLQVLEKVSAYQSSSSIPNSHAQA